MERVKASVWEKGKAHEMEGAWVVLAYTSALALVQMLVSRAVALAVALAARKVWILAAAKV